MPELLLPNIFTSFKGRQANNSGSICSWLGLEPCKSYKNMLSMCVKVIMKSFLNSKDFFIVVTMVKYVD